MAWEVRRDYQVEIKNVDGTNREMKTGNPSGTKTTQETIGGGDGKSVDFSHSLGRILDRANCIVGSAVG